MLKTITRQLFARLNRHLPYRLVHRDPLPGAQTAVNAPIPPSLSERCPESRGNGTGGSLARL
ncbi:magnesium-transporting ATPase MgtA [Salmonella enterica subsp. arizonae]|uniref:Magnesium-transporting ATPase MgtA n=1 Tax=Salmonella enterica subsp. arizonae TaxID=59203 RepID=A0A379TIC0_SALER|nr:magnesium-transporting ATPase MgtA [Salmonella enterica subsp. arizonae]